MNEVKGVVVAHADLAAALIRSVEAISGVRGALAPLSNTGCTPETLVARVRDAAAGGPAILFVDLASGSCAYASRLVGAGSERISVVTGVSLPMLLDFVFHRDMEVDALAARLVEKARAATTAHLPGALARADPPVPD